MDVRIKGQFCAALAAFAGTLNDAICMADGQWAIKGFIDVDRNIYTISSDTKLTSKILEIHLFPLIADFASQTGYDLILPEHQNHYPDVSFVSQADPRVKFAVDIKTTYRKSAKPHLCNGFTLGSHGEYFRNRQSTKNIRFPYGDYLAHFCLGVIYDRVEAAAINETVRLTLDELPAIASVMGNMQFFVAEKWQLAGDRRGSGNTANIGGIELIEDVLAGRGMFSLLGEDWFDEFWINYGLLKAADGAAVRNLADFVKFKGGDPTLIVPRRTSA